MIFDAQITTPPKLKFRGSLNVTETLRESLKHAGILDEIGDDLVTMYFRSRKSINQLLNESEFNTKINSMHKNDEGVIDVIVYDGKEYK
ncbi:hypothetical protein FKG96_12535 [Olivibacter sp. LS-1]|uniref:hypothetical protein n=1 Tax=Olivibacter sp. LS-1 TaxID=2592345 RepID=UPI0011EB7054|nr:hypothetical protein [Olivibacter sp. LS-1]QEL01599.1 hypothetical protein FKG96_12535 [Olivibacter sp. LS-1]